MGIVSREGLVRDLRELGVVQGAVLLVHASLSRLGDVIGGEQTVIEALLDVLGPEGTLVMPAQSWHLCDPEYLDPQKPPDDCQVIRDNLPAYDRRTTPTRTMGAIAEVFRTWPGAVRSGHPHRSFAALGPRAEEIVAIHELDSPNGERSPLKAMYDLGAHTLLLGVGHDKSTILHLAERRSGTLARTVRNGAPLLVDGARRWVEFDEVVVEDDDFPRVGEAFAAETGMQRTAGVGDATAHLMPQRPLVDFATVWFAAHRGRAATGA